MTNLKKLWWPAAVVICAWAFSGSAQDYTGLVGRWPFDPTRAVAVSEDFAFLGSGSTLLAANVSAPASPHVAGYVAPSGPVSQEIFEPEDKRAELTMSACQLGADSRTVALWHFSAGAGQTITDASGNGHDLTLGPTAAVEVADPTWSMGRFDYGLLFDSSICDVQVPNCVDADYANGSGSNTFPGNQLSVELWVLPTGGSGSGDYAQIFTAGFINCFMSTRLSNNSVEIGIGDGMSWELLTVNTNPVDLDDGDWHYLAMTYDGNDMVVYVDGEAAGSGPATTVLASPGDYKVGGRPFNTFLDGWMDELRLSDIARSSSEIAAAWNAASLCPPPILFFDGFETGDTSAWSAVVP